VYLNLGFFLNRHSIYARLKTCRNFKSQVTLRLTLAPGKAFFAGLLFLLVLPFTGTAQIKKMAILPTLTYLDKEVLREGIDSVSQHTIQRNEGYANQSKNYLLLTQKNAPDNILVQPFAQTNALLAEAGITYANLANLKREELAAILGVDLIFYGMNFRAGDGRTQEQRLAINIATKMVLPPLVAGLAVPTDKPITTMYYLLYEAHSDRDIWQYNYETKRPTSAYAPKLQQFLSDNFTTKR